MPVTPGIIVLFLLAMLTACDEIAPSRPLPDTPAGPETPRAAEPEARGPAAPAEVQGGAGATQQVFSPEDLEARLDSLNELYAGAPKLNPYVYRFTQLTCQTQSCQVAFNATHRASGKAWRSSILVDLVTWGVGDPITDESGGLDEAVDSALVEWEQRPDARKSTPVTASAN